MSLNPYVLRRLPLVPDQVLLVTRRAYLLAEGAFEETELREHAAVKHQLALLHEGLRRVEEELQARGIGGTPWWSSAGRTSAGSPDEELLGHGMLT